MTTVVPLSEADDEALFGAKAVGLGDAIREGLPVPPGVALSGDAVEAIASGDGSAVKALAKSVRTLAGPLAVRSSCVDEDGAEASFAGQHLTLLNVPATDDLQEAVRQVWWSANSDSAITYRQRVGLFARPSVGVVVQSLLDPESAGVMFTTNPVTGASERMIEATWGLGEAVVAGRVIPDQYRVDPSGTVLERTAGLKKIAIRPRPDGGTVDEPVAPDLVEGLCLDDAQLQQLNDLAAQCERIYGPGRDIEWAFAGGRLYLLQCRAVTRGGASKPADEGATKDLAVVTPGAILQSVPLFAELSEPDLAEVARLFKERRFAAGETVTKEGAGGAAFFVIGSGDASVTIGGNERATLSAGDYFGEIALIDEGARTATITATTDLVCYGLTLWDFRPLVERHPTIGWKLLQALAQRLREA
ncbi:MAG TPA: PEP/pyruvate-binding domain-containing protein [Nocardioidaceae bacterium]|nr:PEP/pyruvate-binding domain-containing protein [Nocardioidaceae bacterium]